MCIFFFQAEDGIRDLVRSRGLGDVYKRQVQRSQLADRHRDQLGVGPCFIMHLQDPDRATADDLSLIHI